MSANLTPLAGGAHDRLHLILNIAPEIRTLIPTPFDTRKKELMRLRELLKEIRDLGLYSTAVWEEYLSHFQDATALRAYLAGTAPVPEGELLRRICSFQGAIATTPGQPRSTKIITLDQLSETMLDSAQTLALVSGAYDLLHLGHVTNLAHARRVLEDEAPGKLCAMLLSDEEIRRKKGRSRPVLDVNDRVTLMAALPAVDYVVPLEEPDCLAVLRRTRPTFFFKSRRDLEQEIVRQEVLLAESQGTALRYFASSPYSDMSTTSLLNKLRRRRGLAV